MFTGIITGVGEVVSVRRERGGARLEIRPPARYGRFERGESVAVSGVCLTAIRGGRRLVADISAETLRRSTLGQLRPGRVVNLERALAWGDRLSGHFVLGHVDGICRLLSVAGTGNSRTLRFSIPAGMSRFVVEKGSVALDGVSLTVAVRGAREFRAAIIPETRRRTTLGQARAGARLNFEADVFARYGAAGWRRRISRPRRAR
jgi:riboflavin synthase